MIKYVVFISIILSLLIYVYVAWKSRSDEQDSPENYYLAKGTTDPNQFAITQTAYQLQMATIYPFFLFAFTGTWWIGFINNACYFLGIAIYYFLLPRFNRGSVNILGKSSTIHSAIANLHSLPQLRILTGWMTVIAFAGLAAFEITWGSRVFKILFDGGELVYYLAIATLATYLVLYVWAGGQKANINSAQFQLLFAYAGLHSLVAWMALHDEVSFHAAEFALLVPAIIILSLVMLFIRFKVLYMPQLSFLKCLNFLTIVSLGGMLIGIILKLETLQLSLAFTPFVELEKAPSFWLIALSVGLLPLFFQFVDTSNWQRLTSLIANPENIVGKGKAGLFQYLIESPLSWLLPIFIGLCGMQFMVVADRIDPWDALLATVLVADGYGSSLIVIFVFVGFVAIFMSTAEELLTALAYVYAYDLSKVSRNITARELNFETGTDNAAIVNATGRSAMAIATGIVIGAFIIFDVFFSGAGHNIIGLFLAFFSPLIAMAPSLVVPAVTGRIAHKKFVIISLAFGAAAGLFCGLWSLFLPSAFGGDITWFGSLAAFSISWTFYIIGLIGGTKLVAGTQYVR